MTKDQNDTIKAGMVFAAIARTHFEMIVGQLSTQEKNVVNMLIKRLNANENDITYYIKNDAARQWFQDELRRGDTLQFAHIVNQILDMDNAKRDLAERVIDGLVKGELCEFIEP